MRKILDGTFLKVSRSLHSRLRPSQRERRVLRMRSVVQQLEPVAVGVLHRVEHATHGKRMGIVGVIDPVALHEYAAIPLMIEIFVEERLAEFGKLGGSLDCGVPSRILRTFPTAS